MILLFEVFIRTTLKVEALIYQVLFIVNTYLLFKEMSLTSI